MDVETLVKRRAEVVARHETLVSVPGSGWHPDDPQPQDEQRSARGRGAEWVDVSKRPVAIQVDDAVYLVGPDVAFVREKCAEYAAAFKAAGEADRKAAKKSGGTPGEPVAIAVQADKVARKVAAGTGDVIELPTHEWNAVNYALSETKVTVVSTGLR